MDPLTAGAIGLGLGGVLGGLFGGGEKKPKVVTRKIPRWWPEQEELLRGMISQVRGRLGQTWSLTPTPEEREYLSFLQGYEPWARGVIGEAYRPAEIQRYYREVVYPTWEATVEPRIRAAYAGPGYWVAIPSF